MSHFVECQTEFRDPQALVAASAAAHRRLLSPEAAAQTPDSRSRKERTDLNQQLPALYNATTEDMLFGIGQLAVGDCPPVAYIHIHYPDWGRE